MTESLKKRIDNDGCYTRCRMLEMALNVDLKQRKTIKEVYGSLPRATMRVQDATSTSRLQDATSTSRMQDATSTSRMQDATSTSRMQDATSTSKSAGCD